MERPSRDTTIVLQLREGKDDPEILHAADRHSHITRPI
jgi:hypothetical protein